MLLNKFLDSTGIGIEITIGIEIGIEIITGICVVLRLHMFF